MVRQDLPKELFSEVELLHRTSQIPLRKLPHNVQNSPKARSFARVFRPAAPEERLDLLGKVLRPPDGVIIKDFAKVLLGFGRILGRATPSLLSADPFS